MLADEASDGEPEAEVGLAEAETCRGDFFEEALLLAWRRRPAEPSCCCCFGCDLRATPTDRRCGATVGAIMVGSCMLWRLLFARTASATSEALVPSSQPSSTVMLLLVKPCPLHDLRRCARTHGATWCLSPPAPFNSYTRPRTSVCNRRAGGSVPGTGA